VGRPPQLELFAPAPGVADPDPTAVPEPAPASEELSALGQRLPPALRLGTSSWSFPGWTGLVYARDASQLTLARAGLPAYARHPLLRTVGIDRTFYGPVPAETFRGWAAAVPEDFRFLAKAHEELTLARFPHHERYGARRGERSPRFLDAAYAADAVVAPFVEGLGDRAGPLVFQFPPQGRSVTANPAPFAERLGAFLRGLPRGPVYAVEFRDRELLASDVIRALAAREIEARPVWKPMHLQPLYEGCERAGGDVSVGIFRQGICLPSSSSLSAAEQDEVIATFRGCARAEGS